MDYEKLYKEALERARKLHSRYRTIVGIDFPEEIFPELKESEDEKIRKEIITHCRNTRCVTEEGAERMAKWIAWLEKQGEQNFDYEHADIPQKDFAPIEPKFKVGDFIVDDKIPNYAFCVIEVLGEIYKVVDIDGDDYRIPHCKADKQFHLWTIQDAKDGDVLAEDSCIFIIQKLCDYDNTVAKTYCILHDDGDFTYGSILYFDIDSTKPATKEQCDKLEKAMLNAGYKWNKEELKLEKI